MRKSLAAVALVLAATAAVAVSASPALASTPLQPIPPTGPQLTNTLPSGQRPPGISTYVYVAPGGPGNPVGFAWPAPGDGIATVGRGFTVAGAWWMPNSTVDLAICAPSFAPVPLGWVTTNDAGSFTASPTITENLPYAMVNNPATDLCVTGDFNAGRDVNTPSGLGLTVFSDGVSVDASTGLVAPGAAFTATGSNWQAGDTVTLTMIQPGDPADGHSGWTDGTSAPLGTVTVDANGHFSAHLYAPSSPPAGWVTADNTLLLATGHDPRTAISPDTNPIITTGTSLYIRSPFAVRTCLAGVTTEIDRPAGAIGGASTSVAWNAPQALPAASCAAPEDVLPSEPATDADIVLAHDLIGQTTPGNYTATVKVNAALCSGTGGMITSCSAPYVYTTDVAHRVVSTPPLPPTPTPVTPTPVAPVPPAHPTTPTPDPTTPTTHPVTPAPHPVHLIKPTQPTPSSTPKPHTPPMHKIRVQAGLGGAASRSTTPAIEAASLAIVLAFLGGGLVMAAARRRTDR